MANLSALMNTELTGASFDYAFLPAVGVAGGAVTSWRRDLWNVSSACIRRFSVTTKMSPADGHGAPWWLTNVYGPSTRADKQPFLQELRDVRASCPGPWMVCGDFNLIYMASDKNNGRLHRGLMRRFREVIDDLQLDEIHVCSLGPTDVTTRRWSAWIEHLPPWNGSNSTRTTTCAAFPPTAPTTPLCCSYSTPSHGQGHDSASTLSRQS